MEPSIWDPKTLQARVADTKRRLRFPGGSPDNTETAAYGKCLPAGHMELALVLGMTPELRNLAARRTAFLLSIDASTHSIAMYKHWLDPVLRERERILQGNWFQLLPAIRCKADVVMGDGVFANLTEVSSQLELLRAINGVLKPGGHLIARKVMIPAGFSIQDQSADALLRKYRSGSIDAVEFGFGMRITGGISSLSDPHAYLLKNAEVFRRYRQDRDAGHMTDDEYKYITRFYFAGDNCILTQKSWETFLSEAGFEYCRQSYRGKLWYSYYPVYCARKTREVGIDQQ